MSTSTIILILQALLNAIAGIMAELTKDDSRP